MTGQLPLTVSGHHSYSLATAKVRTQLDELLGAAMQEYGLTPLEIAGILADRVQDYLRDAVRAEQRRNPARKNAIGTPREDD